MAESLGKFGVDPAFEAGSHAAAEWPLCHVRLQDDMSYPWLILIPRLPGMVELADLSAADRAQLMEEVVRAGETVHALAALDGAPVDKLNVGALGNVTAQLHVHVVGRRRGDPTWPGPVWGQPSRGPYAPEALAARLSALRPPAT